MFKNCVDWAISSQGPYRSRFNDYRKHACRKVEASRVAGIQPAKREGSRNATRYSLDLHESVRGGMINLLNDED